MEQNAIHLGTLSQLLLLHGKALQARKQTGTLCLNLDDEGNAKERDDAN